MEHEAEVTATAGPATAKLDAGLLLSRLEERILKGDDPEKVRALLGKESLWQRLGTGDRLRWAEMAQMAEDTNTARLVLDSLNREHPDCLPAWQQHLELLSILGQGDALAGLLARARPHIGETGYARWLENQAAIRGPDEGDLQAAADPFDRHHFRVAALQRFMDLFAGRRDCFARQWSDRQSGKQGYVPERRPMGPADLEEHLAGRKTYGIYLMQPDGLIRTAVLDADLKRELRGPALDTGARSLIRREAVHLVSRIKELSEAVGAFPLVEFSGSKGYHFWYFFDTPVSCGPVRTALGQLVKQVSPDLTTFGLEVFPKQDQPGGKGFGNLVKLPLGLHRLTGKRSFFSACSDRSVEAQLNFLATVQYSNPGPMIERWVEKASAEVVVHPRWRAWAETYPALYRLQAACAPLAQAMSLCLDGGRLTLREEKILYQTIGFLPEGVKLLHHLLSHLTDYNPHLVDYRHSRLRGTPLGCRKIHTLLGFAGPICRFTSRGDYFHPLLHIDGWQEAAAPSEKVTDLNAALERLQTAILQVERFLK